MSKVVLKELRSPDGTTRKELLDALAYHVRRGDGQSSINCVRRYFSILCRSETHPRVLWDFVNALRRMLWFETDVRQLSYVRDLFDLVDSILHVKYEASDDTDGAFATSGFANVVALLCDQPRSEMVSLAAGVYMHEWDYRLDVPPTVYRALRESLPPAVQALVSGSLHADDPNPPDTNEVAMEHARLAVETATYGRLQSLSQIPFYLRKVFYSVLTGSHRAFYRANEYLTHAAGQGVRLPDREGKFFTTQLHKTALLVHALRVLCNRRDDQRFRSAGELLGLLYDNLIHTRFGSLDYRHAATAALLIVMELPFEQSRAQGIDERVRAGYCSYPDEGQLHLPNVQAYRRSKREADYVMRQIGLFGHAYAFPPSERHGELWDAYRVYQLEKWAAVRDQRDRRTEEAAERRRQRARERRENADAATQDTSRKRQRRI